jgi:hypothetical protein
VVTRWGQFRARPSKSVAPGRHGQAGEKAFDRLGDDRTPGWSLSAVVRRPGLWVFHPPVEKSSPQEPSALPPPLPVLGRVSPSEAALYHSFPH